MCGGLAILPMGNCVSGLAGFCAPVYHDKIATDNKSGENDK
jgi:hypothetical protein